MERQFSPAFDADFERKNTTNQPDDTFIDTLLIYHTELEIRREEVLRDVDILLERTNPLEHRWLKNSMNVTT